MSRRAFLAQALVPLAATIVVATYSRSREVPPTSRIESRIDLKRLILPTADALPLCGAGVRSRGDFWYPLDYNSDPNFCNGNSIALREWTEYCDGTYDLGELTAYIACPVPLEQCETGWRWSGVDCIYPEQHQPVNVTECVSTCPQPDPCPCDEGDCPTCIGKPIDVTASALYFHLDIFPLDAGFPPHLTAIHLGQGGFAASSLPAGGPLGPRWTLNLAPALSKVDVGTPPTINALTEDGAVIPFEESGGVWIAKDSRVATLTVTHVAPCEGTALLTLGNGARYSFHEPCGGTDRKEGRIQRIDRPNGEFLVFTPNAYGLIETVANRFGSTVTFVHDDVGRLKSVVAPTQEVFEFSYLTDPCLPSRNVCL